MMDDDYTNERHSKLRRMVDAHPHGNNKDHHRGTRDLHRCPDLILINGMVYITCVMLSRSGDTILGGQALSIRWTGVVFHDKIHHCLFLFFDLILVFFVPCFPNRQSFVRAVVYTNLCVWVGG